MQIQKVGYSPACKANFVNNKSFQNVVNYAKEKNSLVSLDSALNSIKKANRGTITIVDGVNPQGGIFSTFMLGRKAIPNSVAEASSPAEATLDAIIELGLIGSKKFKAVFGNKVENHVTPENIIKEYTVEPFTY
jgi:hypothetical protein